MSISRREALTAIGLTVLLGNAAVTAPAASAAASDYENGRIPLSELTRLSIGNYYLESSAAAGFEALRPAFEAAIGVQIAVSGTYRTYEAQVALFTQRYVTYDTGHADVRTWNGVQYWRVQGQPATAVPGTSVHGWGKAIDFSAGINNDDTTAHRWMDQNAHNFGWVNPDWARTALYYEPWHWEYVGGGTNPPPSTETPVTYIEELLMAQSAIVFFNYNGTVFEADLLSGTYRAMANSATFIDRQTVLSRSGVPFSTWDNLEPVANPAAFGTRIAAS